jgi:hypothetical protein
MVSLSATKREAADTDRQISRFEVPSPAMIGRSPSEPDGPLARRHVDHHQVHGPAPKPVLSLRRCLARQRNFMTVEAAHSRPMHRNFAAVEADLALRRTPLRHFGSR